VARASGLWDQYHLLLTLLGATCAFLMMTFRSPFLREARTFLGDTGSMLLGRSSSVVQVVADLLIRQFNVLKLQTIPAFPRPSGTSRGRSES